MLSDAKLLAQIQVDENVSFDTFFLNHYDRVYGVLFRLLGNQTDAEDVAQQVFLKLYHSSTWLRVQGDGTNLVGWLYRVAVNAGYNALRSKNRRRAWYEKLARLRSVEPPPLDPTQITERQETQARVRQILAGMKPRDAKLLMLRHSGLSYKELAETLNVAPGSIGSLLTRAERAFEKKYRSTFVEEE